MHAQAVWCTCVHLPPGVWRGGWWLQHSRTAPTSSHPFLCPFLCSCLSAPGQADIFETVGLWPLTVEHVAHRLAAVALQPRPPPYYYDGRWVWNTWLVNR